jgi:hypothetical protein
MRFEQERLQNGGNTEFSLNPNTMTSEVRADFAAKPGKQANTIIGPFATEQRNAFKTVLVSDLSKIARKNNRIRNFLTNNPNGIFIYSPASAFMADENQTNKAQITIRWFRSWRRTKV